MMGFVQTWLLVALLSQGGTFTPPPPPPPQSGTRYGPWVQWPGGSGSPVYDSKRNCVWFCRGALWKLDLATDVAFQVAHPGKRGYANFGTLGLEGDHLWIGSATALWMYDIPTDNLLLYTAESTVENGRPGLPHNWVNDLWVEPGKVWLCTGYFPAAPKQGLTCFSYAEAEHSKRWVTYTVANTESRKGANDGLLSDSIDGLVKHGDQYLLFSAGTGKYQKCDPAGPAFVTNTLVPDRPLTVPSTTLKKGPMRVWGRSYLLKHVDLEHHAIWFFANLFAEKPWDQPGVQGAFQSLVRGDVDQGTYLLLTEKTSESRDGARDGLVSALGGFLPDGQDYWIGGYTNPLFGFVPLQRYNFPTGEFTTYDYTCGYALPKECEWHGMCHTPDSLVVTTAHSLLRYYRSDEYPQVVASTPADGATTVAPQTPVTVTFNLPMQAATFREQSVELWVNGGIVTSEIRYDEPTRQLKVSTQKGLPGGVRCELVLKSLIQAANGNPLRWTRIKFGT